jgi:hypothetical protein
MMLRKAMHEFDKVSDETLQVSSSLFG